MKIRVIIEFLVVFIMIFTGCGDKKRSEEVTPPGKPNIILITSDQQRKGALEVYGNKLMKTPALNTLAADGIIFARAYIAHPTCTPSRASILTGQYASRHGAYTIGTALPEDALKLIDILIK